MTQADGYDLVAPGEILVRREARQRKTVDAGALEESIAKHGILNPLLCRRITPEGDFTCELIAGERRLTAAKALGLSFVPVRFLDTASALDREIIELEENFQREALPWRDFVRAVGAIHEMFVKSDPNHTQKATAVHTGVNSGELSKILRVYEDIESPRVATAHNYTAAFAALTKDDGKKKSQTLDAITSVVGKISAEAIGAGALKDILAQPAQPAPTPEAAPPALAPAAAPTPAASREYPTSIAHAALGDWENPTGERFNLIHADLRGKDLAETLTLLSGVAAQSAHLVVWFDLAELAAVKNAFRLAAPDWLLDPSPMVWHKTDAPASKSTARPHVVYETALLATRGERPLIRAVANVYACPMNKKTPREKPESLLRHFLSMFIDSGTKFFDPECFTGASLRAAESLKPTSVFGLNADAEGAAGAQAAMRQFRKLREIAK